MRRFGFRWAKAEYDWVKERLTDYNVGWANVYSERRVHFSRHPHLHSQEIHIFLDESWLYEGESARRAWTLGEKTTMQEKGYYRRWGGFLED